MAKKIIKISVNDEYVVGSGVVIGAAGADESVVLRVAFNDKWAGLNIYATFRDALGENPAVRMLMSSMLVDGEMMTYDVVIPPKATATAGKIGLVFSGFELTEGFTYNAEAKGYDRLVQRDTVMKTANAYFRVLPSDFSALDTEDKPEPTLFEQVLAEINNLHGDIVEHVGLVQGEMKEHEEYVEARMAAAEGVVAGLRAEADAGKFKGDKGDKGDKGNKGDKGDPFTVAKTFESVDKMNADFESDGISEGSFVVIETGNVEDEDNAKLYIKGSNKYIYITDLSGAPGIKGDKGDPYKLTDQDRDDIAGVVYEKHFGDIGAALDEIILVQNTLMGKKISFTIKSYDDAVETYEAIDGMTWGKWIDSDYNTFDATSGNMDGDYVGSVYDGVRGVYLNDNIASVTDVIVADAEYYFS